TIYPGFAHRSATAVGAGFSGRTRIPAACQGSVPRTQSLKPPARCNSVHGLAVGISNLAASPHGTGRHSCRLSDCRADPARNRGADRIFSEHLVAAYGSVGRPNV